MKNKCAVFILLFPFLLAAVYAYCPTWLLVATSFSGGIVWFGSWVIIYQKEMEEE